MNDMTKKIGRSNIYLVKMEHLKAWDQETGLFPTWPETHDMALKPLTLHTSYQVE